MEMAISGEARCGGQVFLGCGLDVCTKRRRMAKMMQVSHTILDV